MEASAVPVDQPKEISVTASHQEVGQFGTQPNEDRPASAPAVEVRNEPKVGRNDPCPCGSGQKYKNCGLKNTPEHQRLMAGK
jgi:uncharacterized protein YecA (UPF0149 family)